MRTATRGGDSRRDFHAHGGMCRGCIVYPIRYTMHVNAEGKRQEERHCWTAKKSWC